MKVLSSLSLLSYASMALAVKQFQFCREMAAAPEGAEKQPGVNLTMLTDSTVLAFRLKDLPSTNIPLLYGETYDLNENKDGFVLCTEDMVGNGECSSIGEFKVKVDGNVGTDAILNKFGEKGTNFFYPVKESGVYCLYGYHASEEPGVSYTFYRPYGLLTASDARKAQFLGTVIMPLEGIALMALIAIAIYKYKKAWAKIREAPAVLMFLMALCYHGQLLCLLSTYDIEGYDAPFINLFGYDLFKPALLPKFVATEFYCVLMCIFNALIQDPQGKLPVKVHDKRSKVFKHILLITLTAQIWDQTGFFGKFETLDMIMGIIKVFDYLPIYISLFIYSRATTKRITDNQTKRKFTATRRLAIITPIFLQVISAFSIFILSYQESQRYIEDSGADPLKDTSKIIFNSLDSRVSASFKWAVLENLSSLSFVIIIVGYCIIWRENENEQKANDTELNLREVSESEEVLVELNEKK